MKIIKEYINEKFTQDSDPISDLNIGIFAVEFNKIYNERPEFNSKLSFHFFGIDNHLYSAELVYNILKLVTRDKLDVQRAYELAFKKLIEKYYGDVAQEIVKKRVKGYFKKKFNVVLKLNNLNEKFEDISDPISDLNIGDRLFIDKKLLPKKKTLFFIEVEEPNGNVFIFNNKGYKTRAQATSAYDREMYSSWGRNIKKHKSQGYKFRVVEVEVDYKIINIENL